MVVYWSNLYFILEKQTYMSTTYYKRKEGVGGDPYRKKAKMYLQSEISVPPPLVLNSTATPLSYQVLFVHKLNTLNHGHIVIPMGWDSW